MKKKFVISHVSFHETKGCGHTLLSLAPFQDECLVYATSPDSSQYMLD